MTTNRPPQSNGFSVIEVLVVLLVVAVVGTAGYLVWRSQHPAKKSTNAANSATDKTKSDKSATDPKTGWLRYTTPGGEYSMSLPDGWMLTRLEKTPNLTGYTNDLSVKDGTRAQVEEINYGKDGLTTGVFIVYDVPKNIADPRANAEKTPSFYTDDGLLVEVHRYIEEVGGDFLGDLPKGTREYTYRIHQVTTGHILQVTYLCPPAGPDHHAVVESAVRTISIPK